MWVIVTKTDLEILKFPLQEVFFLIRTSHHWLDDAVQTSQELSPVNACYVTTFTLVVLKLIILYYWEYKLEFSLG